MVTTPYEIERIKAVYESSGKSAKKAVKLLKEEGVHVSDGTILKYWRDAGYVTNGRGMTSEIRRESYLRANDHIIRAYDRYEGNAALAAKNIAGANPTKINNVWRIAKEAGLIKDTTLETRVSE